MGRCIGHRQYLAVESFPAVTERLACVNLLEVPKAEGRGVIFFLFFFFKLGC